MSLTTTSPRLATLVCAVVTSTVLLSGCAIGDQTYTGEPVSPDNKDGVSSPWQFSSKELDRSKYTTTPFRVTENGMVSGQFDLGGDAGSVIPLSFIPVDKKSIGTALVVVTVEAKPNEEDLSEDYDEAPEKTILNLIADKPGTYQVKVTYDNDASEDADPADGWTAELQLITVKAKSVG